MPSHPDRTSIPSALGGGSNTAGARGVESLPPREAVIVDCGRARGRDARVRPGGGVIDTGDLADWVGGGVGRQTGPGYQASFGVWGSCPSATGALSRLAEVADVIEYEVEEDGSYHWTMWAWTGAGTPSIPRQEAPAGAMA